MEKPSDWSNKSYLSLKQVIIPASIDDKELEIVVDVINCEIPLLLSKQFVKDADSTPDFVSDCITRYGKRVVLMHTSGVIIASPCHQNRQQ